MKIEEGPAYAKERREGHETGGMEEKL